MEALVNGEHFVRARNIVIIGDFGSYIYGLSDKSHHSIVTAVLTHADYANAHGLTEIGDHPRRWLEKLLYLVNRN